MLAILTSHPIQYQAPLWRALAAAGVKFEVWFLTPHAVKASFDREFGHTFAWDLDLLEGYPHRFLPIADGWRMNHFNGVRLASSWQAEFDARGITTLWVEGWRFREFWSAIRAAHATGRRVWLRGETTDLVPRSGWREFVRERALRWLFARVDRFLCIGAANRRFYRSLGIEESRLSNAPYSVDNARFARAAGEFRPRRAELRNRWGIVPGAFVVLFCGKLIPKKRPLDLVAAARLISPQGDRPVHLLFAGDGELAGPVREALRGTGVAGTVTGFLNQTEIPAAYAAADCVVLPSEAWETWGLVINEALASGVPAIASDRCGCAEDLVRPFGAQFVFPCGDPPALALALTSLRSTGIPDDLRRKIVDAHAPERTVETVRALLAAPS